MDDEPVERAEPPATVRPPGTAPLPDWWWSLALPTRRLVAGAVAAVVVLAVVAISVALLTDGATPTEAERFVADLPAERLATWDRLADCESEGQWSSAEGAAGSGGLQITAETWRAVGGTGLPHQHSREEQIMRAEAILDELGWSAWPACAAQLGLR